MAPRKTSFNTSWKKKYPWIDSVSGDQFRAFCKICNKSFSVSGKGEGSIKEHADTNKHQQAEKDVAGSHSMTKYVKSNLLFNENNFYLV